MQLKPVALSTTRALPVTGIPQKLAGHEIHPMARIVAITDTYDALTTQRSYNVPMTPRNALEFMNNKLKGVTTMILCEPCMKFF